MPSPYGNNRNAAQYYQYGGAPRRWVYQWTGLPQQSKGSRTARQLGASPYEVEVLEGDDYIDVVAQAQFHKTLDGLGDEGDTDAEDMRRHYEMGDYTEYPVAMSMETGLKSVRHSGEEQTTLYDALPTLGFFGAMSDNEKRALVIVAVAGAGYLFWRSQRKKTRRANPRRRRRRR